MARDALQKETFVLTGLDETLKALKQFDNDAVKKFNKVINDELAQIKVQARSIVAQASSHNGAPMSGWAKTATQNPQKKGSRKDRDGAIGWAPWNPSEVASGIMTTRAQGRTRRDYTTSAGAIKNASAAGRIFELAGRKSSGRDARGQQFIKVLNARYGKASRDIWKVVDGERERFQRKINDALNEAKTELQRHLNKSK